MTSRILIADDSLTIQKVINITLANSGYELVECLNEVDLFKKIESNHFDLILLDFNLSDTKSGYELAKKINNSMPGAAIIVMLGTFDSVDEGQFAVNGIADKIVKPFESSKFIKKCKDLLEGIKTDSLDLSSEFKDSSSEDSSTEELGSSANLEQWTVDAPVIESKDSGEDYKISDVNLENPLKNEIEGWGFAGDSLEEKFQKTFPPVIEDLKSDEIIHRFEDSSTFVSTTDLDLDLEATDPNYEVPEDLNRDLLTEIDDNISADAFWAVDEVVSVEADEKNDIAESRLEDVTEDLTETVQAFKERRKPLIEEIEESVEYFDEQASPAQADEKATAPMVAFDEAAMVEKLKASLRPMIEEMVREFCRQSAERVAWEVIPDLAENLIRKEIKEISESVQH